MPYEEQLVNASSHSTESEPALDGAERIVEEMEPDVAYIGRHYHPPDYGVRLEALRLTLC